nr:MFS transporter [Bacillus subtilis]
MGIALIPLLIVFILFVSMAKDSPAQPSPQPLKSYLHVFGQKETWFFCLLYSVTFGGFVGLSSFLSIFFVDQYQLSKIHAGDFVTLCVAAGSFFRYCRGLDFRSCRRHESSFCIVCHRGTVYGTGVSSLPSLSMVIVLLFVGMMGLGMGNGAVFQLVPQRFRKEIGMVTGIVGAVREESEVFSCRTS